MCVQFFIYIASSNIALLGLHKSYAWWARRKNSSFYKKKIKNEGIGGICGQHNKLSEKKNELRTEGILHRV